jgi:hypothetical protein
MPRASKTKVAPAEHAPAPQARDHARQSLKVATIQGVPYWVNDSMEVFVWNKEGDPLLKIGSTDAEKKTVTLDDTWEAKMGAYLAVYRQNLKKMTEEALKKAEELQGAT